MIAKLPRKLLIGILSAVVLTVLAISAVPVMAADSSTTTTTPTTTTTTTPTTTTMTTVTTTQPPRQLPPVQLLHQQPGHNHNPKIDNNDHRSSTAGKNQAYGNWVNPGSANQGQTLSVTVTGTGFTGAKGVSFGGGIDVTSYSVDSDTQITANIVIANRAFVGTRFVGVGTPSGRGTLPAGFSVTSDAPTVTGVNPATGNQGATLTGLLLPGRILPILRKYPLAAVLTSQALPL